MSAADDRPTPKIEVSFVEDPSYPDEWTDITAYVLLETVVIENGRSDELDSMQAGTLTFQVRNDDRRFDPDYTSSPYYPHVRPNKRIRFTATWDGDDYRQFTGFVKDWGTYQRTGLAIASVQCVDALGTAFAQSTIPDALTLAIGQVSDTLYVDPFTGDTGVTLAALGNLTSIELSEDAGATGGTFRIRKGANWTAPIPYTATCSDILGALEALPGVTVYSNLDDNFTTIPGSLTGLFFYFAGADTGVDISADLEVDFSNLTPTDGYMADIRPPPTTNVLPTSAAATNGWPHRASMTASSATIGSPTRVWLVYNESGTRTLQEMSGSLYDAQLSTDITTNAERVFTIAIEPNPADVTRQVTVGLVTEDIDSALSGAAFTAVAIIAGWSETEIDTDAGDSTMQTIDPVGSSPINLFQLIASSEGGIYYVSRDGLLTFKSRSSAAGGSVVAALTGAQYEDIATDHGERYIYNDVMVTRAGGGAQRAQSPTSIRRYYLRAFPPESGLLMTTDAEALSRARALLAKYKEPRTRITSVRPLGVADPNVLWPIILSAELTNKYSIGYAVLPGGAEEPKIGRLEKKRIEITATNWRVEWSLSPTAGGAFILGSSLLGGTDVLFY